MWYIHIMDNDPTAALVTQRGLQFLLNAEVQVDMTTSPGAALQRCSGGEVDLLIIDPGTESQAAVSIVRHFRVNRPQVTIVILTAYDSPRLREQMRGLGVQYYLAKPIGLCELEQMVRGILGLPRVKQLGQR